MFLKIFKILRYNSIGNSLRKKKYIKIAKKHVHGIILFGFSIVYTFVSNPQ